MRYQLRTIDLWIVGEESVAKKKEGDLKDKCNAKRSFLENQGAL